MGKSLSMGISAFLLLAGVSIGYYFLYSLPQHNMAILELEKERISNEKQMIQDAQTDRKLAEEQQLHDKYTADCKKGYNFHQQELIENINKYCMTSNTIEKCAIDWTNRWWHGS